MGPWVWKRPLHRSCRKGGRSLLSASAGDSHVKDLDGLHMAVVLALSPRTFPRDQPGRVLPLFQSKQTLGGCAASPGRWCPPGQDGGARPPACTHRAEEPREGRARSH